MKGEEDTLNWREEMKNDKNFSQDVPFDFKQVAYKIEKASKNPEKLNPYYTISAIFDCTKVFYSISSALSMGFSDITEKCGIMRERFKQYPEATDIQNLLEIEMNMKSNVYKLNGDNNGELGHGTGKYKNYISACRTFLRLLWFLEYLTDVFDTMLKDDGSGAMKTILGCAAMRRSGRARAKCSATASSASCARTCGRIRCRRTTGEGSRGRPIRASART